MGAALRLCFIIAIFYDSYAYGKEAYVTYDSKKAMFQLVDARPESGQFVAWGTFRNTIGANGWSFLTVNTTESFPDSVQTFAAGLVESYLTRHLIEMHWNNTMLGSSCFPIKSKEDNVKYSKYRSSSSARESDYCARLSNFLDINLNRFMRDGIGYGDNEPYFHQMKLILFQLLGLIASYDNPSNRTFSMPSQDYNIDVFGLFALQISSDLEDLGEALKDPTLNRVKGSGSCSAIVKVLDNNEDILISHDTWSSFSSMLRILKRYDMPVHLAPKNTERVPGRTMTFSSYPGCLTSGDDFYVLSSKLVSMETTIGNSNPDLWKDVTPYSVFEGFRSQIANRLAATGLQWAFIFKKYNSGTYNNQWMVVDYNNFYRGKFPLLPDLITVVEQIPSLIESGDQTPVLRNQSYWPSYNIPFYKDVFNKSGQPASVAQYGDWFSYDGSPRARIFKRDQNNVKDVPSLIKLMRYNDFKNDPLSRCNCTPPYSAENAISARCDLNPANGKYPFGALGHRNHGGTDMKVTSFDLMNADLSFVAVSGPTHDQQPVFKWSTSLFPDAPHHGHPDSFDFQPIRTDWPNNGPAPPPNNGPAPL